MTINLGLNKLPWYGQVGAFALLAVGAVGVYWNFYAVPAQLALDEQRNRLMAIQTELDRAQATARRLPEFRREVSELEVQLEHLRAVLPEERDVADLLRRVQAMATQSNLTIRGFAPHAVAKKQMHAEWPIGLQLEGTYHDLGAFLERVSRFPRIINVNGISIKARAGTDGPSTITADCTATTFVLLDTPAAAAGKPGAPAVPGQPAAPAAKTE
jgi:type IV pilus assembly protein PilO